MGVLEEARDAADGAARAVVSERDDVKVMFVCVEWDLVCVCEECNVLWKDLEVKVKVWRDMEEEY